MYWFYFTFHDSIIFPLLNFPYLYTGSISERGGKLVVLGSGHFFADPYLEKEDNERLRDAIFRYLTTDQVHLNAVDAEDPEVGLISLYFFIYFIKIQNHACFLTFVLLCADC